MSARVFQAVEAFRKVEATRLRLDKLESELSKRVHLLAAQGTTDEKAEYFELTNDIVSEFALKREVQHLV